MKAKNKGLLFLSLLIITYCLCTFSSKAEAPAVTLHFSTYLGGVGSDSCDDVVIDEEGNCFVTGYSNLDVFVTKFAPDGTILNHTSFGGSDIDRGYGIALDNTGAWYVTGSTESTNFPLKNATFFSLNGSYDVFVSKFNSTGSLVFSTYIGGSDYDTARDIAVDAEGSCYVTGYTRSPNFPLKNAVDSLKSGNEEAFVFKLNSSGGLVFSTFLGGSGNDDGTSLGVDQTGSCYIAGTTLSFDFPILNAFLDQFIGFSGISDGFVTKLNTNGSLIFSTYLGGHSWDLIKSIAVAPNGYSYLTGYTYSDQSNSTGFPLKDAFDRTHNGISDAFVTCLSNNGELVYSTYLGGSSWDNGYGIALDELGRCYISGHTDSTNFPMENAFDTTYTGGYSDLFIARLDNSGDLNFSTFFGGDDYHDYGYAIAATAGTIGGGDDVFYIAGMTESDDFYTLNASMVDTDGHTSDGYVARFSIEAGPPGPGLPSPQPITGSIFQQYWYLFVAGGVGLISIIITVVLIVVKQKKS